MLKKYFFVMLGLFIALNLSYAQDSKTKGFEISQKVEKANENFVGERSTMTMILIDAHGTRIERIMQGKVKEIIADSDKSMSDFQSPLDVKGTKLLTWAHRTQDDEQWLWLPSLRRVKRISGSNKSASFMGSEFSYEDLGGQAVEKYEHNLLKESKEEGEDVWVIERTPKKESGYSKQILYISKKYMAPVKIDYFDRKQELLKIAICSNWKDYTIAGKKMWRSNTIEMKNLQTQKQSIITWSDRQLGVAHPDRDFEQSNLK